MFITTTSFISYNKDEPERWPAAKPIFCYEGRAYFGTRYAIDTTKIFEFWEHASRHGVEIHYIVGDSYHQAHIDEDFDNFAKMLRNGQKRRQRHTP